MKRMGERERDAYRLLAGKHEWKRPLGSPTHRWEDNIIMNFQEVGGVGMDLFYLFQGRKRYEGNVHPCTGSEALYRLYSPEGE